MIRVYFHHGCLQLFLNGQIICPGSAAGPTGFTKSTLVLLEGNCIGAGHRESCFTILDLWTTSLFDVTVHPIAGQDAILHVVKVFRLSSVLVAGHLEKVLVHGHLVHLHNHVLGILLSGQLMMGKWKGQVVCRANHTLVKVWGRS